MPLPALNPPPRTGQKLLDDWLYLVWRKLGEASNTAPISVSGAAATATTAASVPPMPTVGAPVVQSDPGSFAFDSDTGTRYYNPTGDPGGWVVLA
jgi:hypothetical protein